MGRPKKENKGKRVLLYLPREVIGWLVMQENKSRYVANLIRTDLSKNPQLKGLESNE